MQDTNLRNQQILNQLAPRQKEYNFSISLNSDLHPMQVNINMNRKIYNHKIMNIIISNDTDLESNGRMRECLKFWIRFCIELEERYERSFLLRFYCDDRGKRDCLSMDSEFDDNLIPDEYSMRYNYKKRYRSQVISISEFSKQWLKRKHTIFWRGSTTGGGSLKSIKDVSNLMRVKVCKQFRDTKGFDFRISKIVQEYIPKKLIRNYLQENNILGRQVLEYKFASFCYYLDIPGNALSWGTIRKHMVGNLVFRADYKRKLFYYKLMEPWKHYIPIDEDFSDLNEKFLWAEGNPNKAAEIAWNGYKIAHQYIKDIPEHFINTALQNIES